MKQLNIMPTMVFLVALLALPALHFLLPLAQLIPSPCTAFGVIFLLGGVVLNLQADAAFRKAGTTVKPGQASSALLTTGVFRLSRNPMYLGFALILAGSAVLFGSLAPLLVTPLFMLLVQVLYIGLEERMLTGRFGQAYLSYKRKVRRWI